MSGFGDKIRNLRRKRGWTQTQLARALDVTPTTVSRWERGAVVPHHREGLLERTRAVLGPSVRAPYLASGAGVWQSPPELLELVREVTFGGRIQLDPCTAPDNPTNARRFLVQYVHTCGLRDRWERPDTHVAYINPDFRTLRGSIDPFKAIYRDGTIVAVGTGWARRITADRGPWVTVVPCRPDTAWYGSLQGAADAELQWRSPTLGSRLHFIDPDTGEAVRGSTFPAAVLFKDGPQGLQLRRFREAFGPHGVLR